jgi:hypothetical protein
MKIIYDEEYDRIFNQIIDNCDKLDKYGKL